MTLKRQIDGAAGDAAELERLYREARAAGNEVVFREAIRQSAGEHPKDILFSAWTYRLDVRSPTPGESPEGPSANQSLSMRWPAAVATSVVLGSAFAVLARGEPPIPIPGEAVPSFWIGWGPLAALGILFFLAVVDRSGKRIQRYGSLAVIVALIAVYTALICWSRSDDIAILSALHLPFVALAAIGAALTLGRPDPAKQCYAFLVKSVETALTGGIYFAAGVLFLGLTFGIFAVLGINLLEDYVQIAAAWGIGAIPVLAVASVYDPTVAPVAQDWATGLTRILRILTQLILPLALAVLVVYDFWFVPAYFWRPFQEREVLMVYNATILAILVLLTVVVSGPVNVRSPRQDRILRYAVLALGGLTLFLNVYALAAITSRIYELGLTPNRYAVIGWNMVTLLMLAVVGFRLWRGRLDPWVNLFRESLARVSVLAVAWALWALIGLPLSFN